VSALWRELHLGTPEAAPSAVGLWRLSRLPLALCTRTTRCPTTSTRASAKRLAEAAREDSGAARTIEDGVSALNVGGPFPGLSADEQLGALKRIEDSDFFELVRSTAVAEVYSDQRTWALVGYEGPSFDKGGYIDRGFDDLDWLPDPESDS